MIIQCTKKLLEQLKMKPVESEEEDPLFSWHANLMTINRRKTVVLTNDLNRFVIVLYGLKAADFKRLDQRIIQGIREMFRLECIDQAIIDQYIEKAKGLTFTKTKNRTMVARLNKACEDVHIYSRFVESEVEYSRELSKRVNRTLVGAGQKNYINPNKEMYKALEGLAGHSIFKTTAVEVKVTLRLANHSVWRRLVLPVNLTFHEFHNVLQKAFGWQDYHLHEFYIYGQEKMEKEVWVYSPEYNRFGLKPLVKLVSNEEAFEYGGKIPLKNEKGIPLSEYMPAHMKYVYDFGDNWQHEIEMLRMIDDYDKNVPVCLDGSGDTPPEDVGGEGGYDELLDILKDPNHPEHQRMIDWSKGQEFEPFDINEVNRELSR